MKIISAIFLLCIAVGCTEAPPESKANRMRQDSQKPQANQERQDNQMPQENQMPEKFDFHASDDEPVINTVSLTSAVPAEEMPPFLQERIKRTPPTITVADVRALQPEERERVLAVVERALKHHRAEAKKYRNLGNPPELIAKDLAMFLNAARQ